MKIQYSSSYPKACNIRILDKFVTVIGCHYKDLLDIRPLCRAQRWS